MASAIIARCALAIDLVTIPWRIGVRGIARIRSSLNGGGLRPLRSHLRSGGSYQRLTLLIPVSAILLGGLVLDERLAVNQFLGMGLIGIGLLDRWKAL